MKVLLMMLMMVLLLPLSGCDGEGSTRHVSLHTGQLLLDASHGEQGSAWGLEDCAACHPVARIHRRATTIRGIVKDKGYASCAGCHGGNGTAVERKCSICHNPADLPAAPWTDGAHSHNFISGAKGGLGDAHCVTCHQDSDMDGRFEPQRDLSALPDALGRAIPPPTVHEFCLRCHNRDHQQPDFPLTDLDFRDPLIAMEDNYHFIDQHGEREGSGERTYTGLRAGYGYQSTVACTDCHAMHGTNNHALIIDNSRKGVSLLDPALRRHAYGVNTQDGDFSTLCVLCHLMEVTLDAGGADTGNGLAGVHEVGVDCRPCHSHGEAVQAGL